MVDTNFAQFEACYDSAVPQPGRFGRYVNVAGAVCSVALMVGLGFWGYKLAVRDVRGIPVIRALEDPMRIAPATPGGEVIMHSGLSVNAVAATGGVQPAADLIVLAPRPVDLAQDDAAGISGLDAPPPAATEVAVEGGLQIAPLLQLDEPTDQRAAVAAALAEALSLDETPTTPLEEATDDIIPASFAPDDALETAGAPAALVRPHRRPGSDSNVVGIETVSAPAPVSTTVAGEIDPNSIPAGTRLAQLGAFDTAEAARAEWVKLQGRFGELLADKGLVIQAAQSGGRTFHRLRAQGFDSEDDARRFCAALLAENATCIPVAQR